MRDVFFAFSMFQNGPTVGTPSLTMSWSACDLCGAARFSTNNSTVYHERYIPHGVDGGELVRKDKKYLFVL